LTRINGLIGQKNWLETLETNSV